jgi:hypothetical protein
MAPEIRSTGGKKRASERIAVNARGVPERVFRNGCEYRDK